MRAAGMAVAADARVTDALVADGAVVGNCGQRIAVVNLRDRCCVATLATTADQLDSAMTVPARFGDNRVVDGRGHAVVPAHIVAGVAPGAADVGRVGAVMAFCTIPLAVAWGRVVLRHQGWFARPEMTAGAVLLQRSPIGRLVASSTRTGGVNGGHVVQRGHLNGRDHIVDPHLFMAALAVLLDALGTIVAGEAVVRLILIQRVGLLMVPLGSGSSGCFVAIRTRIRARRSDPLLLMASQARDILCTRGQVVSLGCGRLLAGGGVAAAAIEIAGDNATVAGAAGVDAVWLRSMMTSYKIDLWAHKFMTTEAIRSRDLDGRAIVVAGSAAVQKDVCCVMMLVRIFGGDRPVFHEVMTTGTA